MTTGSFSLVQNGRRIAPRAPVLIGLCVVALGAGRLRAQTIRLPDGRAISGEAAVQLMQQPQVLEELARAQAAKAQADQDAKNSSTAKPETKPATEPAEATATDKPAGPGVITRSSRPQTSKNRSPIRVADPSQPARFQFYGQQWPEIMTWLADWAQLTLDWQQLPDDQINLSTRRTYRVEEALDLVNGLLLDRGFTMLREDEILRVVNLKTLDPSLVPRVRPEELDGRGSNEFVKVSFPLDTLMADQAAEEVRAMLSPNHKLTPMLATNRLEIVDAVSNLRDVYHLLEEEQYGGGVSPVQEFRFEYARASEVAVVLRAILGLEPEAQPSSAAPSSSSVARQAQNLLRDFQQQIQQQQRQQSRNQQRGARNNQPSRQETPVRIVVIDRHNSVMVTAAPDKMQIVRAAIQILDVPNDQADTLQSLISRTETYRLNSLDPVALVQTLEQVGSLDPTTRIRVDQANRSLVVYAPLADHMMIRMLVDKLDGAGRSFDVIKLKNHQAVDVAGSIRFMMTGKKEETNSNQRRSSSSIVYLLDSGASAGGSTTNEFRVDADLESNSLLLWANDVEMEEVRRLLVKLGEIDEGDARATLRTYNITDTAEVLRRLQEIWKGMGDNPLIIDVPETPAPAAPSVPPPQTNEPTGQESQPDKTTAAPPRQERSPRGIFRTAQLIEEQLGEEQLGGENSASQPAQSGAVAGQTAGPPADESAEPSSGPSAVPQTGQPPAPPDQPQGEAQDQPPDPSQDQSQAAPPVRDLPSAEVVLEFLRQQQAAQAQAAQGEPGQPVPPEAGPAPVVITVNADGRLVVTSSDTQALDMLEQLLAQLVPPSTPKDWEIIHLKYATAYYVRWNLEDYFRVGTSIYRDSTNNGRTLSSNQRLLRFVDDSNTNSVTVIDATPEELDVIHDLVAIYDQPNPRAGAATRLTTMYQVRYSTAPIIAEAVKDVFRDMLSATDRSVTQQARGARDERDTGGGGGSLPTGLSGFKGKLSLGIDEVANVIVISAEGEELMNEVMSTVKALDEASLQLQTTIDLVPFNGGVDIEDVVAGVLGLNQRGRGNGRNNNGLNGPNGPQTGGRNGRNGVGQQNPFGGFGNFGGNRGFGGGGRGGRGGGGGARGGRGGRGNRRGN